MSQRPINPNVRNFIETRQALQTLELNRITAPTNNFTATRDPNSLAGSSGTWDDSSDGYGVSSWWYNATNQSLWVCLDATRNNSSWTLLFGKTGGGGIATIPVADQNVWIFDDTTTMSNPGDGTVRFNNISAASTTSIAIARDSYGRTGPTQPGVSIRDYWLALGAGSVMWFQDSVDPSIGHVFVTTAAPTDNTDWFQFPVSHEEGAVEFTDGNIISLIALPAGSTVSSMDDLSDADTTTDTPSLNEVLKWNGSNWVPGTAGDTTEFTFSIDSFSDGISDTSQLIGSGTWNAVGAITFTATYSNAPGGMTAEVALSGAGSAWSGNLSMTPVTGPETNTEAVTYPSSATGTITFTLSQSADASTDTESVSFSNTMRYGTNANGIGSQTDGNVEALSEVAGPNESLSQTISNIPAGSAGDHVTFAYADRLSDVAQVRINTGNGYITASFNSTATTLAPSIQTSGLTAVQNSAGFEEAFTAITSRLTDLANGSNDFQLLTSSAAQNYIFMGGNTESTPGNYIESDIETGLTDPYQVATNDQTQTWPTVTLASSEHYVFAMPSRLSTPTFYDNDTGFEASFQTPATLSITNDGGYTENYKVFVSTNPLGPGDFNLRTT